MKWERSDADRVFKIAVFQEQFRIAAMPRSFGYDDLFGAGGSECGDRARDNGRMCIDAPRIVVFDQIRFQDDHSRLERAASPPEIPTKRARSRRQSNPGMSRRDKCLSARIHSDIRFNPHDAVKAPRPKQPSRPAASADRGERLTCRYIANAFVFSFTLKAKIARDVRCAWPRQLPSGC